MSVTNRSNISVMLFVSSFWIIQVHWLDRSHTHWCASWCIGNACVTSQCKVEVSFSWVFQASQFCSKIYCLASCLAFSSSDGWRFSSIFATHLSRICTWCLWSFRILGIWDFSLWPSSQAPARSPRSLSWWHTPCLLLPRMPKLPFILVTTSCQGSALMVFVVSIISNILRSCMCVLSETFLRILNSRILTVHTLNSTLRSLPSSDLLLLHLKDCITASHNIRENSLHIFKVYFMHFRGRLRNMERVYESYQLLIESSVDQSWSQEPGTPSGLQYLRPRHITRKLDWKRSIWDVNFTDGCLTCYTILTPLPFIF